MIGEWSPAYEIVSVDFADDSLRITIADGGTDLAHGFRTLVVSRSVAPESVNEAVQSLCEVVTEGTREQRSGQ